ncbi:MAG TPA: hypothetical protein VK699_19850 [Terriglobales bacterium]|jgi:hypothetical protein|nr:hypothetical protein [Terriglobales bacterium]
MARLPSNPHPLNSSKLVNTTTAMTARGNLLSTLDAEIIRSRTYIWPSPILL